MLSKSQEGDLPLPPSPIKLRTGSKTGGEIIQNKIVIDARMFGVGNAGIGRAVEELVLGLVSFRSASWRRGIPLSQDNQGISPLASLGRDDNKSNISYYLFLTKDNFNQINNLPANWQKVLVDARWYTLKEQWLVLKELIKIKPDLVYFPHFNVPLFYFGKYVVTIHDLIWLKYPRPRNEVSTLGPILYSLKNFFSKIIFYSAVKRANKIIVPTSFTKQEILEYFKIAQDKIEVVNWGISPTPPTPPQAGGENRITNYELFIPPWRGRIKNKVKNKSCLSFRLERQRNGGIPLSQKSQGDPCLPTGRYPLASLGRACPELVVRDDKVISSQLMKLKASEANNKANEANLSDKDLKKCYNIIKPYFLYVGSAYPHKNLELLLYAFKELDSDMQLVLVGKESFFYKKIRNLVKELQIDDKVIFTGFVKDEDLNVLYQNALAFVFPSLIEGFGFPPLEAMACGVPVISSNSSCLPEILGSAVIYFDPKDKEDLKQNLLKVINSQELREDLVKKGYEKVKEYSWEKCVGEYERVFKNI